MADLATLRNQYALERPHWETVAEAVRDELRTAVKSVAVRAAISHRAKEVPSLLRKAVVKERVDNLQLIRDKAGARVTVSSETDITPVVTAIRETTVLEVDAYEDVVERYSVREFDYRGIHLEVRLPPGHLPEIPDSLGDLWCEVQVRTAAQTLWADTAHPIYKNSEHVPDEVKRRLHRLMALMELYDEEVMRARMQLAETEGYEESKIVFELEHLFYGLVAREHDPETSHLIVRGLLPLYDGAPADEVIAQLDDFVRAERPRLSWTYRRYANVADRPLLFQPESIMIFERIENDRHRLRERWGEEILPDELLVEMAEAWRSPYDD